MCNTSFYKILILNLFLICSACEEEVPELTPMMKVEIDSLYNAQKEILQKELDSLCSMEQDSLLRTAIDSLMFERLEERRERLGY